MYPLDNILTLLVDLFCRKGSIVVTFIIRSRAKPGSTAVPFNPSDITNALTEGLKKGLGDFEVKGSLQVLGKLLPVFCSVYCFYQEYIKHL